MPAVGAMEAMTRAGFAARGLMYLIIGYVALRGGRSEGPPGALEKLAGGAGGLLLAAMAVGFLGYGLWRLTEAWIDSEGHGGGAKGGAVRAGGAVSGLVHLGLAFLAARLAGGSRGGSDDAARDGAAATLDLPGGWIVLAGLAAGLLATGAYQLVKAARADFLRHLDPKASARGWVEGLGRAGYAARGIVFAITGWFLGRSAWEERASQAGGLDRALASLPDSLEVGVAAGLLLFGLFSLVEARHRRINDPHVLERLGGAVRDAARHRGA